MTTAKDSASSIDLTPKTLNGNPNELSKGEKTSKNEPNDLEKVVLVHQNGDRHTCIVRAAIFKDGWKKARKVLIVVWGNLAGEFALDVERNQLFNFGPGGGLRRHALQWSAVDQKQVWAIWYKLSRGEKK